MEKLDLVVKIGSMALIQKDENAIDYNIFQRLGQIATAAFQGKDLSLAISADENQVKAAPPKSDGWTISSAPAMS